MARFRRRYLSVQTAITSQHSTAVHKGVSYRLMLAGRLHTVLLEVCKGPIHALALLHTYHTAHTAQNLLNSVCA
jgi:hypothetical protein